MALVGVLLGGANCFNPTDAETTGTTSETTTGTTSSTDVSSSAGPTSSGSTSVDPTTGPETSSSSTGQPTCLPSNCPPDKPYCTMAGCTNCSGSVSCADLGAPPDKPHCDESSGLCVECLIDDDCPDTKSCDTLLGLCKPPCEEHSQCGIGACELDVGRCFPKDAAVRYAQADAPGCGNKECSETSPCCSARDALTSAEGASYVIVHLLAAAGGEPDTAGLELMDGGRRIALLGTGSPKMEIVHDASPPVLFLGGPSKLFVAGVALSGANNGAGMSCYQGEVAWIDDSIIDGIAHPMVSGSGLYVAECRVVARRVSLLRNERGAWVDKGGTLELVSSIVGASKDDEVAVEMDAVLRGTYATIVSKSGAPASLLDAPQAEVTLRNSVLVAPSDMTAASVGTKFTLAYSVFSTTGLNDAPDNVLIAGKDVIKQFANFTEDDFHVGANSDVLVDVALWEPGLPTVDIDGQTRPLMGVMDYAGADVPGP